MNIDTVIYIASVKNPTKGSTSVSFVYEEWPFDVFSQCILVTLWKLGVVSATRSLQMTQYIYANMLLGI